VIRPDDPKPAKRLKRKLRTAVHGHFHYPELVSEFLGTVGRNVSRFDLFLSTDTEEKADTLKRLTAHFRRGRVDVQIVPNRGRDIGPLLSTFGRELARGYDVICHVHGKRSSGIDTAMGESWREFLWQHLVGPRYPMMDIILARFAADEKLGLVFPEEPHLCDWDENLDLAQEIAERAGLDTPLPPFFEFPVGTMFWARPQALAPLLDLGFDWDDYPAEPLPNDGTMLHALERLLPFAAEQRGYSYATVNIAGITR
jgi:lipopolysaccharide biosynthesis protein